ncbi:type II secretion system protein N [Solidesulfovibrio sp.]|uniref:type II secretion system protein N n=1 Tax=Solidesulfovibrio sp. TaxID=2910990 RepID=UPI0026049794|nr:type II secretion system protein N [Solidesulfovibrio sp.]
MTESRFHQAVALTCALSLAAAVGLGARTAWFSPLPALPAADARPVGDKAAPKGPPQTAELTRTILVNDIFGLKPTAADAARSAAPPKPAEIDMELTGTVVTANPGRNVAFLREKSGKHQKPYAVGAKVKDATITSIGKNFVILSRQGREEILSMKP